MVFFEPVVAISFQEVLDQLGYAGLTLLLLAETVFPPIPSEAILPLAGYFVGTGHFNFPAALLSATAGSVAGAMLLYEAARFGGRPFTLRFLRFARQPPERLDDAERFFNRRGAMVVLIGRCIPGARSVVSLPAGLLRMGRIKYFLLTLVGSTVWNTVLIGAGWLLGSRWEEVSGVIGPLSKPLLAATVIIAAAALWYYGIHKRPGIDESVPVDDLSADGSAPAASEPETTTPHN